MKMLLSHPDLWTRLPVYRVLPTPGGHTHHHLSVVPGTHGKRKKIINNLPDAFNPSQNAIIRLQMP
jgi:hypothetical protein